MPSLHSFSPAFTSATLIVQSMPSVIVVHSDLRITSTNACISSVVGIALPCSTISASSDVPACPSISVSGSTINGEPCACVQWLWFLLSSLACTSPGSKTGCHSVGFPFLSHAISSNMWFRPPFCSLHDKRKALPHFWILFSYSYALSESDPFLVSCKFLF